ncbi:hypothetical protein NDU88_002847 [Pleurodeles waltl]|uniref:Uncharacterized protein n=1 Tax=Pleurodeles waltl TaxID=8319 RepID=A0AAV7W3B5_PLEWA|nr:hypothetical protein NDU88_002847 [Pleurodeles waltl]
MGKTGRRCDTDCNTGHPAKAFPEQEDLTKLTPGEEKEKEEPTLQGVMQAITASRVALEGKIDALATDLTVPRDDHRRLAEKVNTTDMQLEELRPEIKDNSKLTHQMEKLIRELELRAEDAKSHRIT